MRTKSVIGWASVYDPVCHPARECNLVQSRYQGWIGCPVGEHIKHANLKLKKLKKKTAGGDGIMLCNVGNKDWKPQNTGCRVCVTSKRSGNKCCEPSVVACHNRVLYSAMLCSESLISYQTAAISVQKNRAHVFKWRWMVLSLPCSRGHRNQFVTGWKWSSKD